MERAGTWLGFSQQWDFGCVFLATVSMSTLILHYHYKLADALQYFNILIPTTGSKIVVSCNVHSYAMHPYTLCTHQAVGTQDVFVQC